MSGFVKDQAMDIYSIDGKATYELRDDGRAIHCRCCQRTSHNADDVKHKFCVACGYHTEAGDYLRRRHWRGRIFKPFTPPY